MSALLIINVVPDVLHQKAVKMSRQCQRMLFPLAKLGDSYIHKQLAMIVTLYPPKFMSVPSIHLLHSTKNDNGYKTMLLLVQNHPSSRVTATRLICCSMCERRRGETHTLIGGVEDGVEAFPESTTVNTNACTARKGGQLNAQECKSVNEV
jgi:hypothetical protein